MLHQQQQRLTELERRTSDTLAAIKQHLVAATPSATPLSTAKLEDPKFDATASPQSLAASDDQSSIASKLLKALEESKGGSESPKHSSGSFDSQDLGITLLGASGAGAGVPAELSRGLPQKTIPPCVQNNFDSASVWDGVHPDFPKVVMKPAGHKFVDDSSLEQSQDTPVLLGMSLSSTSLDEAVVGGTKPGTTYETRGDEQFKTQRNAPLTGSLTEQRKDDEGRRTLPNLQEEPLGERRRFSDPFPCVMPQSAPRQSASEPLSSRKGESDTREEIVETQKRAGEPFGGRDLERPPVAAVPGKSLPARRAVLSPSSSTKERIPRLRIEGRVLSTSVAKPHANLSPSTASSPSSNCSPKAGAKNGGRKGTQKGESRA